MLHDPCIGVLFVRQEAQQSCKSFQQMPPKKYQYDIAQVRNVSPLLIELSSLVVSLDAVCRDGAHEWLTSSRD